MIFDPSVASFGTSLGTPTPDGNTTRRSEGFPKEERVSKTKDFGRVYRQGLFARKEAIILYSLANNLVINRFGVSISSRSVKQASRRNRLKRLFREAFRKTKDRLEKGFDIVVVVKKDISKTARYSSIEELFLTLARRVGIQTCK